MPEPAQPVRTKSPGSFAHLLASFAGRFRDDEWDDSALADDVTTITYEQALRSAIPRPVSQSAASSLPDDDPDAPVSRPLKSQKDRIGGQKKAKSASITIRVTAEEQSQLHERAAAAELSVSAYLRSCIFEAEALRAQVKEALAQMQSTTLHTQPSSTTEKKTPMLNWGFFKCRFHRDRAEN